MQDLPRVTFKPPGGNNIYNNIGNQGQTVYKDKCGTASYFVRVALFRDWIDEQLVGAKFCQNSGDADDQ